MTSNHSNNPNQSNAKIQSSKQVELGTIALAQGNDAALTINADDLNEHFYLLGRSGTGKSNLLKQLALKDAQRGAGLCFIDPIGSTAAALASELSEIANQASSDAACRDTSRNTQNHRGNRDKARPNEANSKTNSFTDKEIIYFDAADTDFPIGINPLYNIASDDRAKTVSDILQMFSGIWHKTGWGARMESIFRATLHTLVENPHCMRPSLLTVFRLLLDEGFRSQTKTDIENKQVLEWWNYRFDRGDLNERTRREWVEPVLNKIDTLSLDPVIRNIIGQPRPALDFDAIIRRKQILIVNLNQNKIGLDNAAFIGMLILSRIRQAAEKVGERDKPFTLNLDEAHSFPTMELTKIINQGRHSGLYARIAHQNLDQFDTEIGSAIRNGSGSLAIFAVGSRDAETIVDDLEHQHRERCLGMINSLERGQCLMRLTQDGSPQPPSTYPISVTHPEMRVALRENHNRLQSVINFTRERFAISKLTAEFQIASAHNDLSKDDYLDWKRRFKQECHQASAEHKTNKRAKEENKTKNQLSNFGGAASELQQLADHIFRDHLQKTGNNALTL